MGTIKNNTLGFAVLVIGLLAIAWFLWSRYVEIGECAAIVYCKPLTIMDRLLFVGIGITYFLVSNKIAKPSKKTPFS